MNESLTRREQIAAMCLQGMLSNPGLTGQVRMVDASTSKTYAAPYEVAATQMADSLIAQLKKTKPQEVHSPS